MPNEFSLMRAAATTNLSFSSAASLCVAFDFRGLKSEERPMLVESCFFSMESAKSSKLLGAVITLWL